MVSAVISNISSGRVLPFTRKPPLKAGCYAIMEMQINYSLLDTAELEAPR